MHEGSVSKVVDPASFSNLDIARTEESFQGAAKHQLPTRPGNGRPHALMPIVIAFLYLAALVPQACSELQRTDLAVADSVPFLFGVIRRGDGEDGTPTSWA